LLVQHDRVAERRDGNYGGAACLDIESNRAVVRTARQHLALLYD
jgi:hypothetical protein